MRNRNEQNSGDDSVNVQNSENVSVSNTNNYGLSYTDAKEAALDVFKNNFYKLSGEAADTAMKRVEEFTENLLKKMQEEQEQILDSFKDPDLQYVLFEAQKTVARKNDDNISEILANLLLERTKAVEENLMKITLNEAIAVMSQLTKKQIDLLTFIFTSFYVVPMIFNYKENVIEYFQTHFLDFYHDTFSPWDYQHFNYTGVAIYSAVGEKDFGQYMVETYEGLYNIGIEFSYYKELIEEDPNLENFFTVHLINNEKMIPVFSKLLAIDGYLDKEALPIKTAEKLKEIIQVYTIDKNYIFEFITGIDQSYESFVRYIQQSEVKKTSLTGVGIAIAITNLKNKGIVYPLSSWLGDKIQ